MRDVPQTAEEIAALRAKVDADPQLAGMVVTPDQRAAALVVDFWEDATSHQLAERMLQLAESFRDRGVDVYIAGEPVVALTDVEQSRELARRAVPAPGRCGRACFPWRLGVLARDPL
jgi:hypothetical protein